MPGGSSGPSRRCRRPASTSFSATSTGPSRPTGTRNGRSSWLFSKPAAAPSSTCRRRTASAADLLRGLGAAIGSEPAEAALRGREVPDGLAAAVFPRALRQAELGPGWTSAAGSDDRHGAVAWRKVGRGTIVLFSDARLLREKDGKADRENRALLRWAVLKAAGGPRRKADGRRVPWEPEGLGGAFYPDNEIEVGGVRVLYSDNQLPSIIDAGPDEVHRGHGRPAEDAADAAQSRGGVLHQPGGRRGRRLGRERGDPEDGRDDFGQAREHPEHPGP